MSDVNVSVPYQISQDEAQRRVSTRIQQLRAQYADKVKDLKVNWNGYAASFSGSSPVGTVTGSISVNPTDVNVEAKLPFLAKGFSGRAETEIRRELQNILG